MRTRLELIVVNIRVQELCLIEIAVLERCLAGADVAEGAVGERAVVEGAVVNERLREPHVDESQVGEVRVLDGRAEVFVFDEEIRSLQSSRFVVGVFENFGVFVEPGGYSVKTGMEQKVECMDWLNLAIYISTQPSLFPSISI